MFLGLGDNVKSCTMTLAEKVAATFDISIADMGVRRRYEMIRLPRQVYCYLLNKHVNVTLREIGMHINPTDPISHGNIIHSIKRVTDLMWGDKNLAAKVASIEDVIDDLEMPFTPRRVDPMIKDVSEAVEIVSEEERYICN